MRAAFGLFRDAVEGASYRRRLPALAAEAKWLAGECAPARDLQVFLSETVSDVPPLVRRVANRVARAHLERARSALSGARFTAFDRELSAFVILAPPATAGGRLDDFGRPGCSTGRHAKVETSRPQARHPRRRAPASPAHRHQEAALCRRPSCGRPLRPRLCRAANAYIEATVRLQGALGALNDRAVAAQMLADIATAARPTEDVEKPLRNLAKQAASGDKRRRRKLQRAWKRFRKAGRFWRV